MDELLFLIFLSATIGFGSYIAGLIPTLFSLSEDRMRFFSITGAGLLMGAALCVIIPEGVNEIYDNTMRRDILEAIRRRNSNSSETTKAPASDAHTIVGLTLLLGFIMMLVIDQISIVLSSSNNGSASYSPLPTHHHHHHHPPPLLRDIKNDDPTSTHLDCDPNNEPTDTAAVVNKKPKSKASTSVVASIGLIIHSAADGIALGAAATLQTSSRVQEILVIFFAILLHKAPAAFGLVSFLLHEGLEPRQAKKHLLYFSLAAPLMAFVTFFGISTTAKETMSDTNTTGIALLFSAGTFLYVAAVHVLPEITQQQKLKNRELLCMIGSSFVPLLLTLNHHH